MKKEGSPHIHQDPHPMDSLGKKERRRGKGKKRKKKTKKMSSQREQSQKMPTFFFEASEDPFYLYLQE